jgi:hypothetical protein
MSCLSHHSPAEAASHPFSTAPPPQLTAFPASGHISQPLVASSESAEHFASQGDIASKMIILSLGREVYFLENQTKEQQLALGNANNKLFFMEQHVKQEANKFLALQKEYFALDTLKRAMEINVKNYQQTYLQNSLTEERMFAMNEVMS